GVSDLERAKAGSRYASTCRIAKGDAPDFIIRSQVDAVGARRAGGNRRIGAARRRQHGITRWRREAGDRYDGLTGSLTDDFLTAEQGQPARVVTGSRIDEDHV